MTAQTPVYGLEYIVEGEPVRNTRLALENNAKTIEAALIAGGIAPPNASDLATLSGRVTALEGGLWSAYTPTWAATGGTPAVGNGTLVGRKMKVGRTVQLDLSMVFGSTSNGATGDWTFTLPHAAATGREQTLPARAFCAAGVFSGFATILPGSSVMTPFFPVSAASSAMAIARNSQAGTAVAGTGIPQAAGAYSFTQTHNLIIFGRYESAA